MLHFFASAAGIIVGALLTDVILRALGFKGLRINTWYERKDD